MEGVLDLLDESESKIGGKVGDLELNLTFEGKNCPKIGQNWIKIVLIVVEMIKSVLIVVKTE